MKLGISTNLEHRSPEHWAEQMAELGCGAVVFPVDYQAGDRLIAAYQEAAEAHDLIIAEVGVWNNPLALDPAEQKAARERCVEQLRLAEAVGARCCVNVAGTFGGAIWDGAYKENFSEESFKRTVEFTQELLDRVKPRRSFYTLEPMPWMLPTSPEAYQKLIEAVGREGFGVHMDLINMVNTPERYFFLEDFAEKTFRLLGPEIKSCHLKDVRLKKPFTFQLEETACGEGILNLEHYASLAHAADPDMPMIIEHLHSDEEYKKSLKYVQEKLAGTGLL